MSCARRTAVLDPAETFYDWQQVVKRYSASFKLAFEVCAGKFESLERFVILFPETMILNKLTFLIASQSTENFLGAFTRTLTCKTWGSRVCKSSLKANNFVL
jgi:hypothetical protein